MLGGGRTTPHSSPTKKRKYDRFIPTREGNDLHTSYQLLSEAGPSTPPRLRRKSQGGEGGDGPKDDASKAFNALLKTELFGPDSSRDAASSYLANTPNGPRFSGNPSFSVSGTSAAPTPSTPSRNLFRFASPASRRTAGAMALDSPSHERYSVSPVRFESQKLLQSPRKANRTLSKVPFKVLDAPDLTDDFYLNLVDWGQSNVLAVGLSSSVYLWNAATCGVDQLCNLAAATGTSEATDLVTSINWVERGPYLAVGTEQGRVLIYDSSNCKLVRTMKGHTDRVGAISWNNWCLSSGSRDKTIVHHDVRAPNDIVATLRSHKREVCGLKWNTETNQLASGGNDNKLLVWDGMVEKPLWKFTDHQAAVKAVAWNPHQNGVLASGGGTFDKKIRFWNTMSGNMLSEVDTGGQICNLMWSKNSNELVSTHGFSHSGPQNQVTIWRYPSMSQVTTLHGHSLRVLYLAMSPDGQTIVTGAGDETLRFWHAFPKGKSDRKPQNVTALDPFARIR